MCQSCEDYAAGLIDAVTADVCDDDEIPYVPGLEYPPAYSESVAGGRHQSAPTPTTDPTGSNL